MKTIWKFELSADGLANHIQIPIGAEILCVQTQFEIPCIWTLVNDQNELEDRKFVVFGTGQQIAPQPGFKRKYIGTYQAQGGRLIWHVFEYINI